MQMLIVNLLMAGMQQHRQITKLSEPDTEPQQMAIQMNEHIERMHRWRQRRHLHTIHIDVAPLITVH